jgi:SWI/SNF-related matrix-associated actin-dependent regulator 1 of chromatin subfamily A
MLDRVPTKHRLLLTGTPVQNSPQELLNMLCFIMPLFSRGHKDSLDDDDNNKSVGDRMLQHFVDENMQQNGDEQIAYKKLKHLFAPFVLRRKKCDVIAQLLPPKERHVEFVDLDPGARSIYESIIEKHVIRNGKKIRAAIGDHLFTNLRKAAHHPLMLRTRHDTPKEVEHLTSHFHKYGAFKGEGSTKARVADELTRFNDFHIHLTALDLIEENQHRRPDLERYILDEEALFCSAKFTRLRTLLPKLISEGHRILIFSVWTSCLDLLGCLMEHLGLEYLRMDGSTPSDVRQERIDQFNRDASINVFLLSTKACGLGTYYCRWTDCTDRLVCRRHSSHWSFSPFQIIHTSII